MSDTEDNRQENDENLQSVEPLDSLSNVNVQPVDPFDSSTNDLEESRIIDHDLEDKIRSQGFTEFVPFASSEEISPNNTIRDTVNGNICDRYPIQRRASRPGAVDVIRYSNRRIITNATLLAREESTVFSFVKRHRLKLFCLYIMPSIVAAGTTALILKLSFKSQAQPSESQQIIVIKQISTSPTPVIPDRVIPSLPPSMKEIVSDPLEKSDGVTNFPTKSPLSIPSLNPFLSTSDIILMTPTRAPFNLPDISLNTRTRVPSFTPTKLLFSEPALTPILDNTFVPSTLPTRKRIFALTQSPFPGPSSTPTFRITFAPSALRTPLPTFDSTESPFPAPALTPAFGETFIPSTLPTSTPSFIVPTPDSTFVPSLFPSHNPSRRLSFTPSIVPTVVPTTASPTSIPSTVSPTSIPSTASPTSIPSTVSPTSVPTSLSYWEVWNEIEGDTSVKYPDCYMALSAESTWKIIDYYYGIDKHPATWSVMIMKQNQFSGAYDLFQTLSGNTTSVDYTLCISISTNARVITVGATDNAKNMDDLGAVYVYERESTDHFFRAKQKIVSIEGGERFGANIDMTPNGMFLAVTAWGANTVGAIYLFSRRDYSDEFSEVHRFYGQYLREYLGIEGISIETKKNSVVVHSKASDVHGQIDNRENARSYMLRCDCAIKDLFCSGYETYPKMACQSGSKFHLTLTTDSVGEDTSWEVRSVHDNKVLKSGSDYSSSLTQFDIFDLSSNLCYTFKIYDKSNNGICCNFGKGFYAIKFGSFSATGGEFGSEETVEFGDCD